MSSLSHLTNTRAREPKRGRGSMRFHLILYHIPGGSQLMAQFSDPNYLKISYRPCHRLSKRPNCFRGTCSGLGTWRPRCTRGALSGTRHVVLTPFLSLIAHVTVLMSGVASPMGPVSYMTCASVRAPVPFPQLSPRVRSYRPITPNPCALGQQVTVLLSHLIVSLHLVYFYPDHS